MAGIVNIHVVNETRQVMKALDGYIRDEMLKTIEAREARAQQSLKAVTQQYLEYAEQFRTGASEELDRRLEEYKRAQEEERDYLNEQANQEFVDEVNAELVDEETNQLFHETAAKEEKAGNSGQAQVTENLLDIYNTVPALPVRAMNTLYPGKRIVQETGWDRFVNSVKKGWHYFVKWFKESGWKLLLQIAIDCLIGFIPGIGTMLGMLISEGAGVILDLLDAAKTSAERVALQRAINEGKSRGLDEWDEMFMWRSLIIILMVTIADVEGLTIDGNQLKALMLSRPVFMNYIKDDEFIKDMWKSESKAIELLAGEDPTTNEPDFQLCPQDVDECRTVALELLSEGSMRGFVASIPRNLKPFKDILK